MRTWCAATATLSMSPVLDPAAGDLWYIYRPGRVYVSPDDSKDILGYEQRFMGSARVDRPGDISTLRISTAREEILIGDRLIPAPRGQLINYAPHSPDREINGYVLSTERDATDAGPGWIVTLDKGARDGVDVGTVLATYRVLPPVQDPRPTADTNELSRFLEDNNLYKPRRLLNLPEERTGPRVCFPGIRPRLLRGGAKDDRSRHRRQLRSQTVISRGYLFAVVTADRLPLHEC
jgi:hypothetical protein